MVQRNRQVHYTKQASQAISETQALALISNGEQDGSDTELHEL